MKCVHEIVCVFLKAIMHLLFYSTDDPPFDPLWTCVDKLLKAVNSFNLHVTLGSSDLMENRENGLVYRLL